ncbi:MAG: LysE family translocator [Gammaproteobacteria bacterium]|nr:LysE family translocator [Gammaproteobacteria bacterium]MYD75564.1 LysE family translocator [Gammaproteobacteria bacterium]MYJ51211.1 LysE family translocator [Gammaproteobacteria bacterium]
MTAEHVIAILLFTTVASATPGPNNLMLLSSGINYGFYRTIPHMMGICIGFTFLLSVAGLGLVQMFEAYPAVYQFLKIASAAYLLYLSWKIATAVSGGAGENETDPVRGRPFTFLQAAAFQWVNPKAWTMALTAMTAYLPPIEPILGVVLIVVIFTLVCIPSVIAWTVLGVQMRRFLSDPVRLRQFNILTGCLLAVSLYPVFFSSA